MSILTREQAEERYGEIIDGVWPDESKWCSFFYVPEFISENWINSATGKSTNRIYCNRDLEWPLKLAMGYLVSRGCLAELKTFDGCFNIRDIRGIPGRSSMHAYAAAIDINASENPLGGESKLSPEFVKCFTDAGLVWGGDFHRKDPQHFSLGW